MYPCEFFENQRSFVCIYMYKVYQTIIEINFKFIIKLYLLNFHKYPMNTFARSAHFEREYL